MNKEIVDLLGKNGSYFPDHECKTIDKSITLAYPPLIIIPQPALPRIGG